MVTVPALIVMSPVKLFALFKVNVPAPNFANVAAPPIPEPLAELTVRFFVMLLNRIEYGATPAVRLMLVAMAVSLMIVAEPSE